ncbi:phytanoyl-CoA dioxygenase family protein [Saccharata proteae CBS 121410]|uniref:Phytanoyl-CoA dioxygenase family protein n=1 Tax=Saccharata proteae CBS 121410 TaxID=1314787 RepID=A0A9P4HVM6_9PEZI|nr:phytanoyl-CoA dioxygenase family protein [Saccharata proteae CBS 121410]
MPAAIQKGPVIQKIDASDPEAIIEALKQDGGVIIKNFTTPELVDKVNAETKPYLDADKPWKGALFPPETRRCVRLVSRSPTVRNNWLVHPLISRLTHHFLDRTTPVWYDEDRHLYTTHPILNGSMTLEANPGSVAQRLHRDDKVHHVWHEDQTEKGYRVGSDVSMAFLVPGTETTWENGATLAIPGSHLWGMDRAPRKEEAVPALMQPGDAWCMLGGLYHAGGYNQTKDWKRPMHGMFFMQSILRGEENQYLAHTKEEVLSWSPEVQKIMGFGISSPNLGFVDFLSPIKFLSGDYDPDHIEDLDPIKA